MLEQKTFEIHWNDLNERSQKELAEHIGLNVDEVPYRTEFDNDLATVYITRDSIDSSNLGEDEKRFKQAWKIEEGEEEEDE